MFKKESISKIKEEVEFFKAISSDFYNKYKETKQNYDKEKCKNINHNYIDKLIEEVSPDVSKITGWDLDTKNMEIEILEKKI